MVVTESQLFDLIAVKLMAMNPEKAIQEMENVQMPKNEKKSFYLLIAQKFREYPPMPKEIEIYLSSKI